jgi:hypothetical protein
MIVGAMKDQQNRRNTSYFFPKKKLKKKHFLLKKKSLNRLSPFFYSAANKQTKKRLQNGSKDRSISEVLEAGTLSTNLQEFTKD